MSGSSDSDARWMREAVATAASGLGTTAPNPSVGAVLVRDGMEFSRAVTQRGGRPHAETEALRLAGEAARGATLYVTLEPCSHVGRTGPCAEAVIAAGVARVVVGIEDPDPRVAGRGLAMLRAAGVEVVLGVEAEACRWVTLGHILRVTERRPAVLMKMALGDDLTVTKGERGRPTFVTGSEARAMGHLYRARSDAILVGGGTVRDDDPELTCRLPGMEDRSPIRVVLDGTLAALTPETKLAKSARATPAWVMTSAAAPPDKRKVLEDLGVRVHIVEATANRLNVDAVARLLADEGITRLMIEGGPTVWQAFADRGFIDEAIIFVNWTETAMRYWKDNAADAPNTFAGLTRLKNTPAMTLVEQGDVGRDKFFRFQRLGA